MSSRTILDPECAVVAGSAKVAQALIRATWLTSIVSTEQVGAGGLLRYRRAPTR